MMPGEISISMDDTSKRSRLQVPKPTFRLKTKVAGGFIQYTIDMEHYLSPLGIDHKDLLLTDSAIVLDRRLEKRHDKTNEDKTIAEMIDKFVPEAKEVEAKERKLTGAAAARAKKHKLDSDVQLVTSIAKRHAYEKKVCCWIIMETCGEEGKRILQIHICYGRSCKIPMGWSMTKPKRKSPSLSPNASLKISKAYEIIWWRWRET